MVWLIDWVGWLVGGVGWVGWLVGWVGVGGSKTGRALLGPQWPAEQNYSRISWQTQRLPQHVFSKKKRAELSLDPSGRLNQSTHGFLG